MPQDAEAIRSILSLAPVVPVIILDDVSLARPLAEALVAGGLPVLEVTLRTPNALKVMEEMGKVTGAIVGSGTVRNAIHMKQSVDAGCRFMVSPGASPRLLDAADDIAIPLLPGIGTPSEAMTAAERGYSFPQILPGRSPGRRPGAQGLCLAFARYHLLPHRRHRSGQGQDLPEPAQCHLRRRLLDHAGRCAGLAATSPVSRLWRAKPPSLRG